MLEFQLLTGAVSLVGLALIALGQPPAPSRVRLRAERTRADRAAGRNRHGRW